MNTRFAGLSLRLHGWTYVNIIVVAFTEAWSRANSTFHRFRSVFFGGGEVGRGKPETKF